MNQVEIGRFIAEMRKEQGYTQKELAELLGISDRTVSKWECGKGIPEPSLMLPLCDALHINVNELLSGSRLTAEEYSRKAEENVMNLMEKRSSRVAYIIGVACLGMMLVVFMFCFFETGTSSITYYVDFVSFIELFLLLVIVLMIAGLSRDFFVSFVIAYRRTINVDKEKLSRCLEAVQMGKRTLAYGSIFYFAFYIVDILHELMTPEVIGANTAVAFITVVYGVLGVLLLLPVESRLRLKLSLQQGEVLRGETKAAE